MKTPKVKTAKRPKRPDGQRYEFNCCSNPDVWLYDDEEFRCKTCGHIWTEQLTSNNTD